MSLYDTLMETINELLESNKENLPHLSGEFDKGHYVGYHNALIDICNKLHLTTEHEYLEEDELD